MDNTVKQTMNRYYDERADEYDQFYLVGGGPASINNPAVYKDEVIILQKVLKDLRISGTVCDIPSGTAFWLFSYQHNASKIVFIDQSCQYDKKIP